MVALLRRFSLYDKYKDFTASYFRIEEAPVRPDLMPLLVKIKQLRLLRSTIPYIRDKEKQSFAAEYITSELIRIGLWTPEHAGYAGVTDNWDINSLEGNNKDSVLQAADVLVGRSTLPTQENIKAYWKECLEAVGL